MDISGIGSGIGKLTQSTGLGKAEKPASEGFKDALSKTISEVDGLKSDADQAIYDMSLGKGEDIHKVMIAMEKSDVSFQLMLQVRNKAIGAYEEIMRMNV